MKIKDEETRGLLGQGVIDVFWVSVFWVSDWRSILVMLTFLTNDVFSGMEVGMYFTRLRHENVGHLCVLYIVHIVIM